MRRRRVARHARRQHADGPIEVREVVDGAPRRDHVDEVSVAPVEPTLGHGLLVATELGFTGREERPQTRDRAQRMDQRESMKRAPSPGRRIRAQLLGEFGQRVGERGVEELVVDRTGGSRSHAGRTSHWKVSRSVW